jgi:hypothetical protein
VTDTGATPATAAPLADEEMVGLVRNLAGSARRVPAWGGAESKSMPIAGGHYDQPVPDGVQNPLWEIVRLMPAEEPWSGGGIPEPDSYWANLAVDGMRRAYDAGLDRISLCARYAWSIPSPGDMAWLRQVLDGRGVVEIGAGSGYWAWQMSQSGIDVAAYDPHPPGPDNKYATHRLYHPVEIGDHSAAADHSDRVLLLCWPPYDAPMAADALKAYGGDTVVFVGEGPGGCTADDAFFKLLDDAWDEVGVSQWHVTWRGIHCSMAAYRRRSPEAMAASTTEGAPDA